MTPCLTFSFVLETCIIILTVLFAICLALVIISFLVTVFNKNNLTAISREDSPKKIVRKLENSYHSQDQQSRWQTAQDRLKCCGVRSAIQYFEYYSGKCRQTDLENSVEKLFCDNFRVANLRWANKSEMVRFFQNANIIESCKHTDGNLGCGDILLNRLQQHVECMKLYALLLLSNLTVCLCTTLLFFFDDIYTDSSSSDEYEDEDEAGL